MEEQKLVDMSAALVYNQEILWAKGFGQADLERRLQAGEKTVYNIASVTKLLTATMLIMLRDAGKLDLDQPLQAHLPEFSTRSGFADARPPTLCQVVAHLAGLPREPAGKAGEGWPPMPAFLASLQHILDAGEPGSGVHAPGSRSALESSVGRCRARWSRILPPISSLLLRP